MPEKVEAAPDIFIERRLHSATSPNNNYNIIQKQYIER